MSKSGDKQRYFLANNRVRGNAIEAVRTAPEGFAVTVGPSTRNLDQNAMFHAICSDVAKAGAEWAGKARTADEWKVLFVSAHTKATDGDVEIVPGLEGEFVNIRESTAAMSVRRASSLIEYALAWCASHGIELNDTHRRGFLEDRSAA